jgi:hypothetical protein
VELIVAVGLFALVMVLSSGAYLMMISVSRRAQGIATGIDNLSFAIETMMRSIRTGTEYSCGSSLNLGDCALGGSSFTFKNSSGTTVTYSLSSGSLQENVGGTASTLTDPSVSVSALTFYAAGTAHGDNQQSRVTMTVSGTVTYAPGRTEPFTIETGATMRGSDL